MDKATEDIIGKQQAILNQNLILYAIIIHL